MSKSDAGQELQPPVDKPHRQCDVVIVGAGLSGLRAAQLLSAGSVDVLVLEAQDRVGGRTLTIHPDGATPEAFIDHGGQWVSPGQSSLTALAQDLGVSLFDTWHKGATVDWHNGERSTYTTKYPAYWTKEDINDAVEAVRKLTDMANKFDLQAPWLAPKASQWDDETLEGWLAANVHSPLASALVS